MGSQGITPETTFEDLQIYQGNTEVKLQEGLRKVRIIARKTIMEQSKVDDEHSAFIATELEKVGTIRWISSALQVLQAQKEYSTRARDYYFRIKPMLRGNQNLSILIEHCWKELDEMLVMFEKQSSQWLLLEKSQ